jgi:hypothetical protein
LCQIFPIRSHDSSGGVGSCMKTGTTTLELLRRAGRPSKARQSCTLTSSNIMCSLFFSGGCDSSHIQIQSVGRRKSNLWFIVQAGDVRSKFSVLFCGIVLGFILGNITISGITISGRIFSNSWDINFSKKCNNVFFLLLVASLVFLI